MTRTVFVQVDNELDELDHYLAKLEKKFGSFEFDGKEYILYEREELDCDYEGRRIWTGSAVVVDGVEVEESVDNAETLSDIDITIRTINYTKNQYDEVIGIEDDFWLNWSVEDTCLVDQGNTYKRRIVA